MKKTSIENEIKFLEKTSSLLYGGTYPGGIVVDLNEMSEYISDCYELAKDLYDGLPSPEDDDIAEGNFKYYVVT